MTSVHDSHRGGGLLGFANRSTPGRVPPGTSTKGGGERALSTRNIVHWECQSPEHRALRSRHGNGGLTIHDGAWAYCDGAGADDAHRWAGTGGVPLESLVRWTAPNGGDEAGRIASNGNGPAPAITVRSANGATRGTR